MHTRRNINSQKTVAKWWNWFLKGIRNVVVGIRNVVKKEEYATILRTFGYSVKYAINYFVSPAILTAVG